MEYTKDKKASINKASKAEKQRHKEKVRAQQMIKRANHKASWLVGNVFALIPLIACGSGLFLHSDNEEMVSNYITFISDFFTSGSFLWVSITMLVMSLLELLLNGFKKKISGQTRSRYNWFLIISIGFVMYGVNIFMDNIGTPITDVKMIIISIIAFLFFSISSGIVSFNMVSEV